MWAFLSMGWQLIVIRLPTARCGRFPMPHTNQPAQMSLVPAKAGDRIGYRSFLSGLDREYALAEDQDPDTGLISSSIPSETFRCSTDR